MNPKELVKSFYESDFYKNEEVLKSFIHPECELYWSSSAGFVKFNYPFIFLTLITTIYSFKHIKKKVFK